MIANNSNNDCNNNNQSYDIKCIHHPKQDIIYLCLDCGYDIRCEPACIKCATSNHQGHKLVLIDDDENQDLKLYISINFTNNILPQINEQLENLKSLLDQSNQTYNEIENNHNTNKLNIKKEFLKLHSRLSLLELDLLKQLDSNLDKNKVANSSITTTLQDRIKSTNHIINSNNDNNGEDDQNKEDDDNNYQLIEMINYEYKCRKSIVTNESIKNEYTHYELLLDQTLIDQFYNDSKSFLKLKKMKKTIKLFSEEECTVYEDGDEIVQGTRRLAIKKGHHLPSKFPKTVCELILPDDFDEPLDYLPNTIFCLFIFNIKYKLVKNSIPNSIKNLSFLNGFNQKITKEIITDSVRHLLISDIVKPLDYNSIPHTVIRLVFYQFKHKIFKEIIPSSVTELHIYDVLQPLNDNSIPNSVTKLGFGYGFKHLINKDNIPSSVTELYIYDVLQPLNDNSIPNSVIKLIFSNGFKHLINKDIIPSSVSELHIYDVLQPLNDNSIPNSVTELGFGDGFKHIITKDIIPSSVTELHIYDVLQPLNDNSIPNSVTKLIFSNGFKHLITKDIIPSSVTELYIHDVLQPLNDNSIPNSVTKLGFGDGFKHSITKDIIPSSVTELYLGNITQPLDINSIPNTIKTVFTSKSFKHSIKNLLPKNVPHKEINE